MNENNFAFFVDKDEPMNSTGDSSRINSGQVLSKSRRQQAG